MLKRREVTQWGGLAIVTVAVLAATRGSATAHPAPAHGGWVHPRLLAAPAPPQRVDPPLRITVPQADGPALRGAITAFDGPGFLFEVRGQEGERRMSWTVLAPTRVFRIHEKLLDRDDAEGWLQLGAMLYLREAPEPGEKALGHALRADSKLVARAERARTGRPVGEPEPADGQEGSEPGAGDQDASNRGRTPAGPASKGPIQNAFWGTLSDEVMKASTAELLDEVRFARKALRLDIKVYDASQYFLFVSDMPSGEARRWASLLDRLYDRLCTTFDVPKGTNVFRGRGLIYAFHNERDYHRFHTLISKFDSTNSLGLCKSYPNGYVEISLFRRQQDKAFSDTLVHEAVHGFLHRYRASPHVVSWANEGLAEFVSADLVGLYRPQQVRDRVAGLLRQAGGTGGMLDLQRIDGWQYPIAQALCDFMIAQDRGRYRDFINAIKDGKKWQVALEEDYGVSKERLLAAFGRAMRLEEELSR